MRITTFKEDRNPVTRKIIQRKYFSGGVNLVWNPDNALLFTMDRAMVVDPKRAINIKVQIYSVEKRSDPQSSIPSNRDVLVNTKDFNIKKASADAAAMARNNRLFSLFGNQLNYEYFQAIAKRINPDIDAGINNVPGNPSAGPDTAFTGVNNKAKGKKAALYLFSGPDISTVLETTNADTVVLVDAMPFYSSENSNTTYVLNKKREMGFYPVLSMEYAQSGIWPLMEAELKTMGVKIISKPIKKKNKTQYELEIQYKGSRRKIVFINTVIRSRSDIDSIKNSVPGVGFDFIIPNISKSWQEQKCGFIEVNSLPFINLHHDPLLGQPINVAAKVWDMVGL